MTTNEEVNGSRYSYLIDPESGAFANPFDKGIRGNLREFFCSTIVINNE